MKRLTNARNRCVFCKAADEECAFAAGEFSAPCPDYKTYQRLSAIEDILGDEYDLDRLKELVEADKENRVISKNDLMGVVRLIADESVEECWKTIEEETGIKKERLIYLAKADIEGKCVLLPCKHNDTVWFIKSAFSVACFPIEANYVSIRGIDCDGDVLYAAITAYNKIERRFKKSDIGKTVFLNLEEAEAALEKMKEDK